MPTIPHLRGIKLNVEYRELPETENQLCGWRAPQKWRQDPDADRFLGFAPRSKYYVNGILVGEEKPGLSATSSEPFPEKRVPRRNGFQQVLPSDPEYAQLCKEQGLEHLLAESRSATSQMNGIPINGPVSTAHGPNGTTHAEPAAMLTGNAGVAVPRHDIHSPQHHRALVNGVNGISD